MESKSPAISADRRQFLTGLTLGGLGGAIAGAAAGWTARQDEEDKLTAPVLGKTNQADTSEKEKTVNSKLDHERYMRLAIEQARNVPQLPFGAVIVDSRSGEVLADGYNRSGENPTFHGEIDVINRLAAKGPRKDWSPLALYTTAEPCPMCQGAIEWAGIGLVVFGTSIEMLQKLGWWQIDIRAAEVIRRTPFRKTQQIAGVLADECDALFRAVPRREFREKAKENG
ncbi:MAG TPA: nucleoside deaminase [Pirellulales bacterium]|jgi:tRNA(Arg) A34 adenosine deaminase TadA